MPLHLGSETEQDLRAEIFDAAVELVHALPEHRKSEMALGLALPLFTLARLVRDYENALTGEPVDDPDILGEG